MKCEYVQEQIAKFVVNELREELALQVSEHIQNCTNCQSWYEEVKETYEAWQDTPSSVTVSSNIPDLVPGVMSQIKKLDQTADKDLKESKRLGIKQFTRKVVFLHYSIAASITFLFLQTGMFQRASSNISQMNIQMSDKIQGLIQLFSHL